MKKSFLILSALYIAAMAVAQDVLVIPYNTTSLTEEQRNANPDYIVYPASLEGVDEVDMICNKYVDLGLPSGTKWAKCNVGASTPEEYGDYFAWGETEPKDNYSWSTYKWCNGTEYTLTKYCAEDNKTVLELEDDAATVNWGKEWRTPTGEEFYELFNNCTCIWTTMNGVNGCKLVGSNGNSIFLPAAGEYYDTTLYEEGTCCSYWLNTISRFAYANYVTIRNEGWGWPGTHYCKGVSVRPVLNK